MAPKTARAKGIAAARARADTARRRKNAKRGVRRATLSELNALAEETGAAAARVDGRTAQAAEVERAIHVLQLRCQQPQLANRLRSAVERWIDNGGQLQATLTAAPDLSSPSAVLRHRVLLPEFRLQSRAFMLTYNHKGFRRLFEKDRATGGQRGRQTGPLGACSHVGSMWDPLGIPRGSRLKKWDPGFFHIVF